MKAAAGASAPPAALTALAVPAAPAETSAAATPRPPPTAAAAPTGAAVAAAPPSGGSRAGAVEATTIQAAIAPARGPAASGGAANGSRFHGMRSPGGVAGGRAWTRSGGEGGEPVLVRHAELGELEVPEGMDAETFVTRKLKTLQKAVRRQVEHYFGDANWSRDEHLQSLADGEGYVEFASIMDFERLKVLTTNGAFVRECVLASSVVETSSCGLRLRRPPAGVVA